MQKSFTLSAIFMVLTAAVLFTACRKQVTEVTEVTEVINPAIGIKFTVKPGDWRTQDDGHTHSVSLQVPELDSKIYDHGAVITYISFGTDYYEALPQVFDGIAYGVIHSEGFVTVDFHALDGGPLGAPSGNINLKVVLIPTTSMKAHPGVDLKNFKEVEKTFLKN